MVTMESEQLALWDPEPEPLRDLRPPCLICAAPALARVYSFVHGIDPGRPRKYVTTAHLEACRGHLEDVTARADAIAHERMDAPGATWSSPPDGPVVKLAWALIHQPGKPDARLPGTSFAWHEVQVP